jgi:hypothetical protein
MINAQVARLLNATVVALSDKGLPCGTAEAVVMEVLEAEVKFKVEQVRNRLVCDSKRFADQLFHPDAPRSKSLIPSQREWDSATAQAVNRNGGYAPDPRD